MLGQLAATCTERWLATSRMSHLRTSREYDTRSGAIWQQGSDGRRLRPRRHPRLPVVSQGSPRLATSTRELLDAATAVGEPILVSAVTIVELRHLAEKGTLTELDIDAPHAVLQADGTSFEVAPVDAAVAWAVGRIPREAVRDPWDRVIAATALARGIALATYDRKLQALTEPPTVQ